MSAAAARSKTQARSWRIGIYLGIFTFASGLGDPTGLVSIPILFILKDNLQLGIQQVALFEAFTLLPHYLAFLFGALRDRWRPFNLGDRGYFLLGAPIAAACYFWLASGELSYTKLLVAVFVAMIAFQFIDTAAQALMASVGQRTLMTGRLSAITELVEGISFFAAAFIGGWMILHTSTQTVFAVAAAIMLGLFALSFWKPEPVYSHVELQPPQRIRVRVGLKLLRRHAILPTLGILALYNFSPGLGTPLLYYLTNHLNLSAEAYGTCRAVMFACTAAATAGYGFLCMRYPLKRLLWWSVSLNVLPGLLFLWIGTPLQAVIASGVFGVLAGFANVALFDLLMRSCPPALEGTATMLGVSALGLSSATGDLFGAWLYERSGFAVCVGADALANLIIVPLLLGLPRHLISFSDGEAPREAA